jgi:Ni,Fe-hydrogenase III small subunit
MEDGTEHKFDGIFMACGSAGALDFAANLGLEIKDNMLVVDDNNMTGMEGVFAAGNCAGRCRQIAKNIGDGCNAGVNVIKYLRSRELYMDYGHHEAGAKIDSIEPGKDGAKIIGKVELPAATPAAPPAKKLRIGWFSFSCCEDSTIVFTEILNDYYDRLKDLVEFAHVRVLKKNNDMSNLDIAFIEGAMSNDRQVEEVKKIRANSKKVVAIGACACTGMPSGQRNAFDPERQREIEPAIRVFDYSKKVSALHEVIPVDDSVPGCPMLESNFLAALNKQLKEFGVNAQL